MRTFRAVGALALVWAGAVLWRRQRRSRELVLVVRGAAAATPPAGAAAPTLAPASSGAPHEATPTPATAPATVDDDRTAPVEGAAVTDQLDDLLMVLARADVARPPVTVHLRWRENAGTSGAPHA